MLTIQKTANREQTTFSLSGRLDVNDVPQLEAELRQSFKQTRTLTFDLRGLDFISTAGLRVLLSAQKHMNRQGRMQVTNVGEDVMRKMECKGLGDVFYISDAEQG